MDVAAFRLTLAEAQPPTDVPSTLAALWWAAKGEWDRAHSLVMGEDGGDAAWIHAYLHRVEGDLGNARYWYRAAQRPPASGKLEDEWTAIVSELLVR
jgi:hypothetical protein